MKLEFERYGLSRYRIIVGLLQLLGGIGLLVGVYLSPLLLLIVSAGFFILMVLGFLVRIKIKDGVIKSTPALIYALLSLYICYESYALL